MPHTGTPPPGFPWIRANNGRLVRHDGGHLAELREAGAYRDGRLHPALEEGLDGVLNPVCRLEVQVADAHGRDGHGHGWVAGQAAGFLLPDDDELG